MEQPVINTNITPVPLPNVYPSSINSVTGKLLSERNLSMILRSICKRHFIYAKDQNANTGNFNLAADSVYSSISPGIAVIDGYIVSILNTTALSNIPTDIVEFGEVKQFYLALCLIKQKAVEANVGTNDPIFTSLSFVFLEDKLEDTDTHKYLYLYRVGVNQNAIDTNGIEDLRVYSPFDSRSINIISENESATLQDALDFIVEKIRGLEPGTDFFYLDERSISIQGENGIYDRLKYKFALPDYPDKPFINDMIVTGNELIYSQGQIVTLNSDVRLPNIILPEAEYSKDARGVIFVDPNRRIGTKDYIYDPDNPPQMLYIENGELYTIAEVNQNAYSIIQIKDENDANVNILIPAINKVDTLILKSGTNIEVSGSGNEEERCVTFDLRDEINLQRILIDNGTGIIGTYIDPEPGCEKFSGVDLQPAIHTQNGTVEDELRVGGDLEVQGDINTAGDVNIGGNLTCSGDITADKVYCAVYNDYAEIYECDPHYEYEPGDLIGLNPSTLLCEPASMIYSNLVLGVYSDSYGYLVGGNKQNSIDCKEIPIGLTGRVKVKIVGPALPGDAIGVSHINGVGTVIRDRHPKFGTIVGKCLEIKDDVGIGKVTIQIMLR